MIFKKANIDNPENNDNLNNIEEPKNNLHKLYSWVDEQLKNVKNKLGNSSNINLDYSQGQLDLLDDLINYLNRLPR
jgi:hypothetical protein